MKSPNVAQSFLVHTALDETGDMVVLDSYGRNTTYSRLKASTHGIRLTFPSHPIARETSEFQLWSFKRHENGLILWRAMIAGGAATSDSPSVEKYRPLPVFEVFDLQGDMCHSQLPAKDFLTFIRSLDFPHYPEEIQRDGTGYIEKPSRWFAAEEMAYERQVNKKRKTSIAISSVSNWAKEVRDGIGKMLWYVWHDRSCRSGLSACFAAEEFRRYDTCTYFCERTFNRATLAYQWGHFG